MEDKKEFQYISIFKVFKGNFYVRIFYYIKLFLKYEDKVKVVLDEKELKNINGFLLI